MKESIVEKHLKDGSKKTESRDELWSRLHSTVVGGYKMEESTDRDTFTMMDITADLGHKATEED